MQVIHVNVFCMTVTPNEGNSYSDVTVANGRIKHVLKINTNIIVNNLSIGPNGDSQFPC